MSKFHREPQVVTVERRVVVGQVTEGPGGTPMLDALMGVVGKALGADFGEPDRLSFVLDDMEVVIETKRAEPSVTEEAMIEHLKTHGYEIYPAIETTPEA